MKINFTKEHETELMKLAGEALVNGTLFKAGLASELNVYDLFHNCQISTLSSFHSNIKKEVTKINELDEWSMTEYQQKKAETLKKSQQLIYLLIGYKRNQEEVASQKAKLKELKDTFKKLQDENKTPAERMNEIAAQIKAMEPDAVA